jgi:hypothetical protein
MGKSPAAPPAQPPSPPEIKPRPKNTSPQRTRQIGAVGPKLQFTESYHAAEQPFQKQRLATLAQNKFFY